MFCFAGIKSPSRTSVVNDNIVSQDDVSLLATPGNFACIRTSEIL